MDTNRKNINFDDPDTVTIDDIVNEFVGLDREGDTKTVLYIGIAELFDEEEREPEVIKQLVLHNVFMSDIGFPGDFVMVQMEFRVKSNTYLQSFCELVKEFHHMPKDGHEYGFFMQAASLHDRARYVLSFDCPLICVRGYSNFSNAPTLLQVVFPLEGFSVYPANYNLSEIRAEVGRELDQEEELYGEKEVEEILTSDIEEQVKESYGINSMNLLKGEKRTARSSIDDHIHVTKR